MPITLNGTTGIAGVDGSAGTPAVQGTDTNTGVFYPAADTVGVSTGGSERMRVDSSGNVGIGTTSPSVKFQVTNTSGEIIRLTNTTAGERLHFYTRNSASSSRIESQNSDLEVYSYDQYVLKFGTSNTERMRIDSSGRLLVNSTSDAGGNNPAFSVNAANASAFGNIMEARWTGTSSIYHLLVRNGNGLLGGVQSSGSTVSYTGTSDYRLKENVEPISTGISTINLLKPVTYNWIIDKTKGEGFLAHELQEVIPNAVTGEKDAVNEDGSINPQGVDYSKLVVHLVAAIQELSAKVDAQAAEIAALKANAPA